MKKGNYVLVEDPGGVCAILTERLERVESANRRNGICSLLLAAGLLVTAKVITDQREKINELRKDVKELKRMRGD
jgi:hypothetical protein